MDSPEIEQIVNLKKANFKISDWNKSLCKKMLLTTVNLHYFFNFHGKRIAKAIPSFNSFLFFKISKR